MENLKDKILNQTEEVKKEVRQKALGYILAALGLVAGLAWNEAIKAVIDYFFPFNGNSVIAKLVYAISITFVVVGLSIYLAKLLGDKKEEK